MKFQALGLALLAALTLAAPADAARRKPAPEPAAAAPAAAPTPTLLGKFGDWQAFTVGSAKGKSCFAITNPKERKPAGLNRDPATFFVTHRPGDRTRSELSFIAGFGMKDGSDAKLTVGRSSYVLYAKEANAWVKNPDEENNVIAALRKNKTLTFEATSKRGNKTVDRYSLAGFPDALDSIVKACP